jgi:hypothetical protein
MAIQVLQQPPQIAFAGDPIVVKAKTTLSGKTFLRIKITVNSTLLPDYRLKPYGPFQRDDQCGNPAGREPYAPPAGYPVERKTTEEKRRRIPSVRRMSS